MLSVCKTQEETGNHALQAMQSGCSTIHVLSTGKPEVLAGTTAAKSHGGTHFQGTKRPCDTKHVLNDLSRVAYGPRQLL